MNNKGIAFLKHMCYSSRMLFRYNTQVQNHLSKAYTISNRVISPEILSDVKKFENIWYRTRNNNLFKKQLYECLGLNEELINYVINIILCACSRKCSSELIFDTITTFDDYIKKSNITFCPTLDQKTDVLLSILNCKDYELTRFACSVFKINEQPYSFKSLIEDLLQKQKIEQAAYCISALQLQKEYSIEKILLPLLLDRKLHIAMIYLKDYRDLQLETARILDSFVPLKESANTASYINSRNAFRSLCTLINHLKIPPAHCPNLYFIRSKGAISHLISKRIKQSVSEETWEDMIMQVIQENDELKKFLIQKLIFKKDIKTAVKMAEKFNMKIPNLPVAELSCETVENDSSVNDEKCAYLDISCSDDKSFEFEDICNHHLEFALNSEDIKVISNEKDYVNCINEISQNYSMIGIDSEWKPNFGLERDRLSLIQLAVHDKVFIFDILSLNECLTVEHWDKLLDDIFGNPNIVKLGCGIMTDVHMILESIHGTKGKEIKFSHILDMSLLYQKLEDVYPDKMISKGDPNCQKSLSFLCEIILGKPLNKEERLCDWEKRPLTDKQLEYAALDAFCLIQMYDKLREDSIKVDINYDHLAKVAIVATTGQWRPKRKLKGRKSGIAFHIHRPIPIEQLNLVVDYEFESQGKELRQLGADVVILEDSDTADTAIEISKTQGRMLVCSDTLWDEVKDKVKEGFGHYFPSTHDEPIKVSHFLQHFNAQVSQKSIFSRCTVCNSANGIKLSAEDLKNLQELQREDSVSMNSVIKDNSAQFSSELQVILSNIMSSNTNIKFAYPQNSSSMTECAFLCKICGNIS